MLKNILVIVSLLIFVEKASGQNKAVKFEDLRLLQAAEEKPVVVLIMTDWCKFCHAMQNTMLNNAKVSTLLHKKFYSVFLNAEENKTVFFAGREFKFKHGINELAKELATMNGKLSYPTLCILNPQNEIIYQHDGFLSARAIEYILSTVSGSKL